MANEFINDIIDPEIAFAVEESETGNGAVLAKVKGVFFSPNGESRNKRYYSRSLWEKALDNQGVQEAFKNKTMFGTIGHETELNDITMLEGRVSHIVTNAYIDENGRGIGEAEILDTPSGRILNTLLRAGSKLYVSSRALGRFNGTVNGMPAVDENTYKLKTWDFVLNPGFLEANPELVEAFKNIENEDNQGDNAMDKTLEKLINENSDLKSDLKDLTSKTISLEEGLKPLEEENAHVKEQLGVAEEKIKELEESVETAKAAEEELKTLKESILEVGDSFEEIKTKFEEAVSYIEELHNEVGTKQEIVKALSGMLELKEQYDELGSIEDIKKVFEASETLVEEKASAERKAKVESLCKEFGVSESTVERLMAKEMSEEEIKEFLGELKLNSVPTNESNTAPEVLDEGDDVVEETKTTQKPRAIRIMESMSK
jgi:hypothetical protein